MQSAEQIRCTGGKKLQPDLAGLDELGNVLPKKRAYGRQPPDLSRAYHETSSFREAIRRFERVSKIPRGNESICRVAARFYGTMIDIVPKFMVAVPDWPCIVKCAAAELVLTLLPLPPPVAPPQEVSPAPSTMMSTKTASPRIRAEGRLPFRR